MQDRSIDEALSRLYHTDAPIPEGFETGWRAAIRREEAMYMTEKKTGFKRFLRRAMPALCALVLVVGGLWAGTLEESSAPASRGNDRVMMASRSTANYDMAMEEASYDGGADMVYAGGTNAKSAAPIEAQTGRKLVRSADLTLRTTQFDASLEKAQALLTQMGGYMESLYQYGEDTRRINLNMRVPAEKLDAFLSGTEGLGRISDRSESTIDMTTHYVDNQARLNTLYAKRDRLNELLLKAEDVSDLIEIESAIADTQYQIDSYESTQRTIDNQVDFSTVNLNLIEEKPADIAQADVTLAQRMRAALTASIEWLGDFARDVLVFLVIIAPVAVPAAVIILVVRFIRRRRKTKEV